MNRHNNMVKVWIGECVIVTKWAGTKDDLVNQLLKEFDDNPDEIMCIDGKMDGHKFRLCNTDGMDCETYKETPITKSQFVSKIKGESNMNIWYAVMMDSNDDWGTGSTNLAEAMNMLNTLYWANLIAVIENDVCIEEIYKGDA